MIELVEESKPKTHLSPAQYWEWRATIYERQIAQMDLSKADLEFKLLQKDAENLSIRTQLFLRSRMDAAKAEAGKAHAEYERFREALEKDLGQTLKNKVIDDVTFEIRELPDEQLKQPPTQS